MSSSIGVIASSGKRPIPVKVWYVSSSYTGATSNGTFNTPWKSLLNVESNLGSIAAGHHILFKRGDTFFCQNRDFGGFRWWGGSYGSAPSGTANNPIVLGAYGTGEKPNFLFPTSLIDPWKRRVFHFEGIDYVIFDNLQINDPRYPAIPKVDGALTGMAIFLGENTPELRCNNITVQNCYIKNVGYGIASSGDNNKFLYNVLEEFGAAYPFTSGSYGSVGIELNGDNNLVEGNIIGGGWSWADTFSFNGGAIEFINSNSNTVITRNTIYDCDGVAEFGSNQSNQTVSNILISYNKLINNGTCSFASTSPASQFYTVVSGVKYFNNVIVENSDSRFSGINFGAGTSQFPTNQPSSCPRYPEPSATMFNFGASSDISIIYSLKNNVFEISNAPITWTDAYNSNTNTCVSTRTYTPSVIGANARVEYVNNIYKMSNGATVGHTLGTGELSTSLKLFKSTTGSTINWNFIPSAGSPLINSGVNLSLSKDYNNSLVTLPTYIGIYNYTE